MTQKSSMPPRPETMTEHRSPRSADATPSAAPRQPAPADREHPALWSARAAVARLLSDLLTELRRHGDRLLDVKQVTARTTLSRNTIWGLERAGQFPRRRQITANKVAWLESEIDDWIATRPLAQPPVDAGS